MARVLALLGLLLLLARPAIADEQPSNSQKAAIFAKSSVVRVMGYYEITFKLGGSLDKEYVGGMGSGFFATADGFVVTNAHVIEDIKLGEEVAKKKALTALVQKIQRSTVGADFARMGEDEKITLLQQLMNGAVVVANNDIVLPDGTKMKYDVVSYGKPGEGSDVGVIKVDIKDAPNLPIGDSDRVQLQDKVLAIGYPGAADMQGLLDDKSQLEASINDGAVSAMKHTPSGEPIIQITASITHGNSGGPTINDKGEVIGLSTFGSKGEVQGFNFIVASATVKKFLKEAKANTEPSKTIKLWRKALDEKWAFDLDASVVDLEEVMTLFPTHSEAPRVLKEVRALKKEGKNKSPKSKTEEEKAADGGGGGNGAGIAVAIIVVVLIVVAVIILVIKKKKPAVGVPGHVVPPGHPNMAPPGMPPPGAPGYGQPQPMAAPAQQMYGRVQQPGPQQPVQKTMAIGGQQQHAQVAATAFGSLTMASLTCTRGLLNGQRFALTPQGLLIGRQPGLAQIVVNDSRASGKHVWIGYENGTLVAIDQGTTNGTYINDIRHGRISKAPLKDGDTVIVGEPDCLSLTLKL